MSFCPIRFQGQWEDAETGLYHNRFRYYDPGAGQYASPDPIGRLGGLRPHGYVTRATRYYDAKGLACCCWAGEPGQYLYRGVHRDHPEYNAALNGLATPGDITNAAGITPDDHNRGGVSSISPYTS